MQITKPLYICFTYVKPYFSKEVSEENFSQLESEIDSYIQQEQCQRCKIRPTGESKREITS